MLWIHVKLQVQKYHRASATQLACTAVMPIAMGHEFVDEQCALCHCQSVGSNEEEASWLRFLGITVPTRAKQ
jgi:hypothetical protein